MGIIWLGVCSTGKPSSINLLRIYRTFSWCLWRNSRPSSDANICTARRAPANTVGGSEVVNIKPAAYDLIMSTRRDDPAAEKMNEKKFYMLWYVLYNDHLIRTYISADIAKCFSEGSGNNVNGIELSIAFTDSGTMVTIKTNGVYLINKCNCPIAVCHFAQLLQINITSLTTINTI